MSGEGGAVPSWGCEAGAPPALSVACPLYVNRVGRSSGLKSFRGAFLPSPVGEVPGLCPEELYGAGPGLWRRQHSALRESLWDPFGCCRGDNGARDLGGAPQPGRLPVNCGWTTYQPRDLGQTVHLTSFSKPRFAHVELGIRRVLIT